MEEEPKCPKCKDCCSLGWCLFYCQTAVGCLCLMVGLLLIALFVVFIVQESIYVYNLPLPDDYYSNGNSTDT